MSLSWVFSQLRSAEPCARPPRLPSLWLEGRQTPGDDNALQPYIDGIEALLNQPESVAPCHNRTVYAMLPRHTSALYQDGELHTGTWLRCILMLFHLKRMGVGIVYLLPPYRTGGMKRKGTANSPYAVSDFFSLDESLHDPLLGPCTQQAVQSAVRAFVEACHALGMRVVLDFVLRTCARDNVYLEDHPDWFYYVKSDVPFQLPNFEEVVKPTAALPPLVKRLKRTEAYRTYAAQFQQDSLKADPVSFKRAMQQDADQPPLFRLEKYLNTTVAPAFCDVLSDPQPPWSDVTYLRFEFHGEPCMFYDHIKLAHYPLKKANTPMMDVLSSVIPHYARNFDIDGARIDMGHALPEKWVQSIMSESRAVKPGFLFWCEQLDVRRSAVERRKGYDLMSGALFLHYLSRNASAIKNDLKKTKLPIAVSAETPDTPRSAQKLGALGAASALLFSLFVPGAYPMIHAGAELSEHQPLNLGLMSDAADQYVLDETHPFYGRLAFFDLCAMDWDRPSFVGKISEAQSLAARWRGAKTRLFVDVSHGQQVLLLRFVKGPRTLLCVLNLGKTADAPTQWPHVKSSSAPLVALSTAVDCLHGGTFHLPPDAFAALEW